MMQNPQNQRVHVGRAVRILLSELGVDSETVLRRAKLPSSLLDESGSKISLDDYYRLLTSISAEADDPQLALKLGDANAIDYFDPALFAAMCSPNMNVAAARLADYKQVISPFTLDIEIQENTQITFRCVANPVIPPILALTEIVFLVNFARRATRHKVKPQAVSMPFDVPDQRAFERHFGCPINRGKNPTVTLSSTDAARPFVTHNDAIWAFFEPQLRRQFDDGGHPLTTRTKVMHCLNEFIPSKRASVEEVAKELAMSKRTLQRRLADEGTNWIEVLNDARESLARHYLSATDYGPAEVSLLLGFEDPNSFFRAFKRWENTSPENWRVLHKKQPRELY